MPCIFPLTSHAVLLIFQMRFKVYLDEGHRVAEIFVSAATQCTISASFNGNLQLPKATLTAVSENKRPTLSKTV